MLDINRKLVTKNAYRITKTRGKTALRIRVIGGHLPADVLSVVQQIAQEYGDGTIHLTTRQGFEIPGINFHDMPAVNQQLSPLIDKLEVKLGVRIEANGQGYPSAGTRNIAACIGNIVCPFANVDTTNLAQTIEKVIYPADFHVKIAITGCPNDCIKAHMHDFGIIGLCEPQYELDRCIGCGACVLTCQKKATGAIIPSQWKVHRDVGRCIGCGECVLACPTAAWTRNPKKFYRLIIMGRTGKKNPRLAETFIEWATEDVVLQVIKNVYPYIDQYINKALPKEHVGYILDRTGYQVFKEWALKGVKLNPEATVTKTLSFNGYYYDRTSLRAPA